jgi:hypothetical protein
MVGQDCRAQGTRGPTQETYGYLPARIHPRHSAVRKSAGGTTPSWLTAGSSGPCTESRSDKAHARGEEAAFSHTATARQEGRGRRGRVGGLQPKHRVCEWVQRKRGDKLTPLCKHASPPSNPSPRYRMVCDSSSSDVQQSTDSRSDASADDDASVLSVRDRAESATHTHPRVTRLQARPTQ